MKLTGSKFGILYNPFKFKQACLSIIHPLVSIVESIRHNKFTIGNNFKFTNNILEQVSEFFHGQFRCRVSLYQHIPRRVYECTYLLFMVKKDFFNRSIFKKPLRTVLQNKILNFGSKIYKKIDEVDPPEISLDSTLRNACMYMFL